jgi:dynactin complex subunit
MSKKNKKTDAVGEEIVQEETEMTEEMTEEITETEPLPEETAEENISVAEEEQAEAVAAEEASGAAPELDEGSAGTVSRPVNFRTGPSFKNAVIAELKPGTKVKIAGSEAGDKGTWYKCEFDGRTGYVKASGVIAEK